MTDHKVHAELGASTAARWTACPGSIRLSRGIPNLESEHSRRGTAAHEVAKLALEREVDPDMWLGMTVEGVEVDDDMVEAVRVYVEYCRSLMQGMNYFRIEQKFSLAELGPPAPMFGTADFVLYNFDTRILYVVDYKNGSGVVVEAKGNKQLRYYALGVVLDLAREGKKFDVKSIVMTIVQPRASHPDGPIRSDHIDPLDLVNFSGELMEAARATLDPDAPLHAGSHCRFCPAAATCPEQRERVQSLAQVAFEAMPLDRPPTPNNLPAEVFWDMMSKKKILDDWSRAMEAEALRRLEAGQGDGTFKLVAKRATRNWKSEAQVEKWACEKGLQEDEIYTKSLKSPAQLEKMVGKKNLPAELIEAKSSGYTLAPATDKRPALSLSASETFTALPAGND